MLTPVKTITRDDGRTSKFGRRAPIVRGPRLKLGNYLLNSLPNPPTTCDYMTPAKAAIAQMYDNDSLGDCVIAGMAHGIGIWTASGLGTPAILTNDQIIAAYGAIGGYVPGDEATDNGCDEQTALNYWQTKGFAPGAPDPYQILAWAAVDPSNPNEYRAAIWLFEYLMYGVALPDAWVNPMPSASGFTWDVAGAPDPENGHCFVSGAYDASTLQIATWAMEGRITDAATEYYAAPEQGGELYCALSADSIIRASQRAPNGFAIDALLADIKTFSPT
jgi:hypothetical protein